MEAMAFIDIFVAVLIAAYAMIGGAFLSAALTAPKNTLKILAAMSQHLFEFLIFGLALVATGPITFLLGALSIFDNPFLWIGVAHLLLCLAFYACYVVSIILIDDSEDDDGR
ncbi:hypothetical protein [Roseovarius sp. MMSF_3281]|uniref:hypothetical protein n=1 Tax=Roseovarius sp. MMSF_3281 TaxID=3046694 RepID=UPI00273DDE87|nr:hypothetical protein [Roseovarius sp. MMSF_3281]